MNVLAKQFSQNDPMGCKPSQFYHLSAQVNYSSAHYLLLSLWHARQWMGCSIIMRTDTPLDLQNEGLKPMIALRVHPPAMNVHRLLHISTDYHVLLHIILYYYFLTCPEYSMNNFFLPPSRKTLPTFQIFCPDGVHFAQTVVHFAHFQNQARKRGVLGWGWRCFVFIHIPKGFSDD